MRKLLLLVFVAVMCVPSYGSILVYKTSTTATVVGDSGPTKQKQLGYLVLDVTTATQTVNSAQQITYGGTTQQTKVVTVAFTKSGSYIAADYSNGVIDAVLFGKTAQTIIGPAATDKESVAKSLKGSMLIGLDTANLGSGTFSATLDTKDTKAAYGSTIAAAVESIAKILDKKYTRTTDTTPPTPNPMTWVTEPNATSDTSIRMTATIATDAETGPVEYLFTNTSVTGHNSTWQSSTIFTDIGLTADTNYTYTVKARDSAAVPNETTASAAKTARTLKTADTNAPTPNPMEWAVGGEPNAISSSAITMSAALATDAQGIGGYYFTCVNDGNFNSGWKSPTEDSTNWTASTRTWIATRLTPATSYVFTVKAKDNALVANITADSNQRSATTLADTNPPTPNPMTWATVPEANGATAIYMVATTATDAEEANGVEYYFASVLGGGNDSDWQASPVYQDNGLTPNAEYAYRVRARDASGNPTGWSEIKTATTGLSLMQQINARIFATDRSATTPTYQPLTITITPGTYTEDVEVNEPNITLESASGAAATIINLAGGEGEVNGVEITAVGCTVGGSTGHGFTIVGASGTTVALIGAGQDDTIISYCDLNSVGSATMGIRVNEANGVTIANNNFFDDGSGVYLGGGLVENISITDNHFTKTTDSNFVNIAGSDANVITITGNTADHGMAIQVGPDDTNMINLSITGNTFTLGGILLYEPVDGNDANRLRDVNIIGNTFSAGSQDSALRIDGLEPSDVQWASVLFTGNSILRTPGYGIYNVWNVSGSTPATLKAERNYWNAANGPTGAGCGTTGASVSTFVDFNPYWTTPTGTDANCP